jgi:hypothetical protein
MVEITAENGKLNLNIIDVLPVKKVKEIAEETEN